MHENHCVWFLLNYDYVCLQKLKYVWVVILAPFGLCHGLTTIIIPLQNITAHLFCGCHSLYPFRFVPSIWLMKWHLLIKKQLKNESFCILFYSVFLMDMFFGGFVICLTCFSTWFKTQHLVLFDTSQLPQCLKFNILTKIDIISSSYQTQILNLSLLDFYQNHPGSSANFFTV